MRTLRLNTDEGPTTRPPSSNSPKPALALRGNSEDPNANDWVMPSGALSSGTTPFARAQAQARRDFEEFMLRVRDDLEHTLKYQQVNVIRYIPDQEAVVSFAHDGKIHELAFRPRPDEGSYAIKLNVSDSEQMRAALIIASRHNGHIRMLNMQSEQHFRHCCLLMKQLNIGLEISHHDPNYGLLLQWHAGLPSTEQPIIKDCSPTQHGPAPSAPPLTPKSATTYQSNTAAYP